MICCIQCIPYRLESNGVVFYVGATAVPQRRVQRHKEAALQQENGEFVDTSPRACWIRECLKAGTWPPTFIEIERTPDWKAREQFWIDHYRKQNAPLVNQTEERIRATISIRRKALHNDPAFHAKACANLYRGVLKVWSTPELREKNLKHLAALNSKQKGSQANCAKLTEEQVLNLRRERAEHNTSYSKLAAKFGVSKKLVLLIVQRRIWRHI